MSNWIARETGYRQWHPTRDEYAQALAHAAGITTPADLAVHLGHELWQHTQEGR